ncbi:MAG TPA: S53 family peptidase [Baekduia sp.]
MQEATNLIAAVVAGLLLCAFAIAPAARAAAPDVQSERVCFDAIPGFAACHARVVTDAFGQPLASKAPDPAHFGATDLQSAYSLPSSTAGVGQTIAIVDAFDAASAEDDLAVYRETYGLPPCTGANGCFAKVDQRGGTTLPRKEPAWGQEISLDLDMASATCPNCKLLLVEADSSSMADLGAGVDTAVGLGATVVSNSYGGAEFASETKSDSHYNHPGVAIVASSGDGGYGAEYPAASPYVTAVGGTSLTAPKGVWTSETAWSGSGSGCSAYEPKPSWQTDTGCARRTVADVAAVADPATGVNVYDSTPSQGKSGWMVFGGTSAAAPIVAGVFALAADGGLPSFPYANPTSLHNITSGSNGKCSVQYLCTAGPGYNGPTGLGTPNGVGAF